MSKPVLGLALGGILGVFDGLSALVSAPNDPAVKAGIIGIVIGSTIKGLITGALIGWFAKRTQSLPAALTFGLAVGVSLAYLVCLLQKLGGQAPYYWQIMLPGGILGLIVGYATVSARVTSPSQPARLE
jgi:hypothetical protein